MKMFIVEKNTLVFVKNTEKPTQPLMPHYCAHENAFEIEALVDDPLKTSKPYYTFRAGKWLVTIPEYNVTVL
jgi:hypothetical protein